MDRAKDDSMRGNGFQSAVVERLRAIAVWRTEREYQDMMGLGPEAAARSRRSAEGLREFSEFIAALDPDDDRLKRLQSLCGGEDWFDPGANVLEALGQFRFHQSDAPVDGFLDTVVSLAEQDREEMGQWGGPQVAGDNPWRGRPTISDPFDEEDSW